MNSVQIGNEVVLDYVLTVEGNVYDTSLEEVALDHGLDTFGRKYCPLTFTVGSEKIISGLNCGILGMTLGENRTLLISPQEGYGFYDEKRVQCLPRSLVERHNVDLTPGSRLIVSTQKGSMTAVVTDLTEKEVTFDLNPDLCDKTLHFKVILRAIVS